MHQALERSCLPSDVCRLIEHWHHGILYNIEHEKCHAQVNCHRGIRQGCAISPRVWSLFTVLIMSEMGPEWSKKHISTWFADDTLFQAMVRSEAELLQHIKAISKALWVLQKLGLTVAPTKCAVLLHLGGTQTKRVRDKLVQIHDNKPHMLCHHEDHSWRLPVASKHDYLGATLSYTRMEDLTATRRIQAAQTSFDRLKPVITHRRLPTLHAPQDLADLRGQQSAICLAAGRLDTGCFAPHYCLLLQATQAHHQTTRAHHRQEQPTIMSRISCVRPARKHCQACTQTKKTDNCTAGHLVDARRPPQRRHPRLRSPP